MRDVNLAHRLVPLEPDVAWEGIGALIAVPPMYAPESLAGGRKPKWSDVRTALRFGR